MVVVSKALFDEKLPRHISCAMVHHYEPNCWTANSEMMKILLIGVTKFVFPCTLVKLAINYKKLSKKYLKEIAISHLRTTAYGCSLGMLTISSICCLYRITGPLNYYTLCFVPGVIAGLSLLVEAEDGKVFNCIAFVNLVIEAVFNNINHFRLVNMTKLKQTGLFMVCSSLLMYLLQNRKDKIDFSHFWFYVPPKNQGQTDERKCYHENDCTTYLKEGILNYAMLGFAVNFVKGLIPRMGEIVKNPIKLFYWIFNPSNFRFGIFMSAFVTTYRYISCYLRKRDNEQTLIHSAIAGLISGVTFIIEPNLQILIIAITTILQVIYQRLKKLIKLESTIPMHILFALCNGLLYLNRIFCLPTCPSFYKNMLSIASANKVDLIFGRLVDQYILQLI